MSSSVKSTSSSSNLTFINKLGDYVYFINQLELYTNRDELIKYLHILLYGTKGIRTGRIERILEFNRLAEEHHDRAYAELETWPSWCVKTCLELFGRRSVRDSKERAASALIKYLMQPYVIIRNPLDLSPKQWYFKIEGRKLRDQFPQVSVKSIETHTSKIWEAMSPTDKEVSFAKKKY
jgi:hypothetical protein